MAHTTTIHRPIGAPAKAPIWLVIVFGLLGSGCGHLGSSPPASAEHGSTGDSLVLFPTGPAFQRSAEAEALFPRPWPTPGGRIKRGAGVPSLASASSSWPRLDARRSPPAEPHSPSPLRTADRLDPGSATVR